MCYEKLLKEGRDILEKAGITDCDIDAWLLFEYVTTMGRAKYFINKSEKVSEKTVQKYFNLINARAAHIPLQHITGVQEFMGLKFIVSSDVLVPRQDTETLAEYVLPLVRGKSVLDMCTGSGCLAISLMKLGDAALCIATDFSQKALEIAKKNAKLNNVNVEFIHSDMFDNVTKKFDVIVSNPPYIRTEVIPTLMPEVKEHEPFIALDGGADGLKFYKIIGREARNYLKKGGTLAVEIGYDQGKQVVDLFKESGYKNVCVQKDLSGNDRVVAAVKQ